MIVATLANVIGTGERQKTKREGGFRGFLLCCSVRQGICEALRKKEGRISARDGADKRVSS
ncbi:hypothetical protein D6X60_11685 [Escherichia albertii]|nr:hypothetical protein [Escherichia albertii]EEW7341156.1 hypothetical protein [Escherichia albertii]